MTGTGQSLEELESLQLQGSGKLSLTAKLRGCLPAAVAAVCPSRLRQETDEGWRRARRVGGYSWFPARQRDRPDAAAKIICRGRGRDGSRHRHSSPARFRGVLLLRQRVAVVAVLHRQPSEHARSHWT